MKGISVIIPTYNRELYIKEAIESVLTQDYEGKVEIIISDDGSCDLTLQIARSCGEDVIITEKPTYCLTQGASGARNRGIKASTQPYITFLDSDDYYLPGHLKKLITVIEMEKEADFVFCRSLEMDIENGNRVFRQWSKPEISQKDITHLVISQFNVLNTNSILLKKTLISEIGGFNEEYSNGEDTDLWIKISEQYTGRFSNHFGAVRRNHGGNQLTGNCKLKIVESHYRIYRNALVRFRNSRSKNSYRLSKLFILLIKYRFCQMSSLYPVYLYVITFKEQQKKREKMFPLSYFLQ